MSQQLTSSRRRRCARRMSGYFTVLAALLLSLIAPLAHAQTACNVVYTISSQWGGGFGAAINIQNTGTTAISNWTLTWAFANGQTVSQIWNGTETQSGANVTVTNLSYNGSIPAGGSYSGMGFNGTWNNVTNAIPTSFALNGVTCGGVATGSFKLTPSAATLAVTQGASATDTITVADTAPFAGSVTLAATGLPSGVTATFGTNPTTGSSVVTFAASATATVGTSTVTITGTSGSLTASTTIALTVNAAATGSFTLKPSATSLSIAQGASGTDTITITDVSPFAGSVTLAATGLPTGVTDCLWHKSRDYYQRGDLYGCRLGYCGNLNDHDQRDLRIAECDDNDCTDGHCCLNRQLYAGGFACNAFDCSGSQRHQHCHGHRCESLRRQRDAGRYRNAQRSDGYLWN